MRGLGNTLLGRVIAHFEDGERFRAAYNPKEGYCCALINLGVVFNRTHAVFCSRRTLDGVFCGQHDHVWPLIGAEEVGDYIARHGGKLVINEDGEIVAYHAPSYYRRTPHVTPIEVENSQEREG